MEHIASYECIVHYNLDEHRQTHRIDGRILISLQIQQFSHKHGINANEETKKTHTHIWPILNSTMVFLTDYHILSCIYSIKSISDQQIYIYYINNA